MDDVRKRKEFGVYLASLRKWRKRRTKNGLESWTQKDLSEKIGIAETALSKIENGKVVDLKPYLKNLADAFELNETQRRIFYAKADAVYDVLPSIPSEDAMQHVLENIHYPASIRTSLWDFLAFNEYHRQLWAYSDEAIELLQEETGLSANLLRVQFDDRFQIANEKVKHLQADWRRNAISQFRRSSFPYISTQRYNDIIIQMTATYTEFADEWLFAESRSKSEMPPLHNIPHGTTIQHPAGILSFISLRVPERDIAEGIKISVYVPLLTIDENKDRFDKLMATVTENTVYFFKRQEIK